MKTKSRADTTKEKKRAEASKHDSDVIYGVPLYIGDGISIAMHSPDCRRCAQLIREKCGEKYGRKISGDVR